MFYLGLSRSPIQFLRNQSSSKDRTKKTELHVRTKPILLFFFLFFDRMKKDVDVKKNPSEIVKKLVSPYIPGKPQKIAL